MENRKNRIFTVVLLCVYAVLLVWIVLLKLSAPADLKYLRCERSLNLIPFHYGTEVGTHLDEVILNVLVFIPLGLYCGMLGRKAWKAILIGFGVSLAFEAVQYAFAIGAADVTDLISNTAGTAIGVCIYLILHRVCRRTDRLYRVLNIVLCIGTALFVGAAAFLLLANA
jgi:glycopeptide antibiotics resistance protein